MERKIDHGELAPYRDQGAAAAYAEVLERKVAVLESALEKRVGTDIEVQRSRLAIHVSASMTVYAAAAAFCDGPYLGHPHLAAFLVAVNLLIWTIMSVGLKFG